MIGGHSGCPDAMTATRPSGLLGLDFALHALSATAANSTRHASVVFRVVISLGLIPYSLIGVVCKRPSYTDGRVRYPPTLENADAGDLLLDPLFEIAIAIVRNPVILHL